MGGELHRVTVRNLSPYVQSRANCLFPPGRLATVSVDRTGLVEIKACKYLRVEPEPVTTPRRRTRRQTSDQES